MSRRLLVVFVLLLTMTTGMLLHYVTHHDITLIRQLGSVVAVTRISSPVLSVGYSEPRFLVDEKPHNPAYPEMPPISSMEVVYAR